MERVIFWNNKGGTGKTTLTFQIMNMLFKILKRKY